MPYSIVSSASDSSSTHEPRRSGISRLRLRRRDHLREWLMGGSSRSSRDSLQASPLASPELAFSTPVFRPEGLPMDEETLGSTASETLTTGSIDLEVVKGRTNKAGMDSATASVTATMDSTTNDEPLKIASTADDDMRQNGIDDDEICTHSPATPWGVINFAVDTAEILSYSGLMLVLLLLPAVLYFAFVHRFLRALGRFSARVWDTLLGYPRDPRLRRAAHLRTVARGALALRAWLYVMGRYAGLAPLGGALDAQIGDWGSLAILSTTASTGALVIACLPARALASLIDTVLDVLLFAPGRACSRIGKHVRENAVAYVFAACGAAGAYSLYRFVGALDEDAEADEAVRRLLADPHVHRQIVEQLAALRAELQSLQVRTTPAMEGM